MIKAVIFDFGNVIYSFDNNIFIEKLSRCTSKSCKTLYDLIYRKSNLPKQYETGLITSDDFYESMVALCDLSISKPDFIRAFTDKFTPIQTTMDIIKKLKPSYKLGLISNVGEWDYEYAIKKMPLFPLFDTITASFLVGAMKPDTKIFEDAFTKLNLPPEQCAYVDDIEEFANAANSLGAHGIRYVSKEMLVTSLVRLGVRL